MRRRLAGVLFLSAAVVSAVVSCTGAQKPAAGQQTTPAPAAAPGGYADVVERVTPGVVTVQTTNSIGSGVVYRPDVVITNEHVVGQSATVTIAFADGNSSSGTVLARDAVTDLAVVRTDRKGLTPQQFRKQLPRPGDGAIAIGSPLGLQNSVTAGVVSGLHRKIPGSAAQSPALADLIQTDAPISPGNSGGALLDTLGQVIGINDAYIPPEAGAVSLGFAIPSSTAVDVADQLLANGKAVHPYLGVSLGDLTPSIRQQLGAGVDSGAVVLGVDPGSPAAAAGVQPGDVIVRFNDTPIANVADVLGALRTTKPGDQVVLTIVRHGDQPQLKVTVGAQG
jgi:S1-C subfamily serine protease